MCRSVADLSGEAGVNREIADRFCRGRRLCGWQAKGRRRCAILLLGEKTTAAAEAFRRQDKASDYLRAASWRRMTRRIAARPLRRGLQRPPRESVGAKRDVAGFAGDGEAGKPLPLVSSINPAAQAGYVRERWNAAP
jgi:hypothetical protein